jgi:arylsulfatase A-like enzyme
MQPAKGSLIEPSRLTIASLLRDAGYTTAMIGKWHLGFDGGDAFDYAKPLRGGPCDHGFDSFFGQHASLDIPPYFYIANDRAVAPASEEIAASSSPDWSPIQGAFWRAGKIAPGFKHPDALPTYTRKAVEYLEARGRDTEHKPFFLYLALTAPHTPWLPMEEFHNKSLGGLYGDFVGQLDDSVGQVLHALDRAKLAKNTLVFFASDNGPVWLPKDVQTFHHSAAGPLRGMKGDAWEGGHRMPFIARWPHHIKAGSECTETICFTDMLATFAALTGRTLPAEAGEDSYNVLGLLLGQPHAAPLREATIHDCAGSTVLSIRAGDWKLIPILGSAGFSKPSRITPKAGEAPGQLYNLADDLGETKNLYAEKPEIVARLTALLAKYQSSVRSAPGKRQ